jgi:tol-pal system protein YbgF
MIKKIIGLILMSLVAHAFAEVPVVDYASMNNADQRINKIEQQVNNINEQNLVSKIDELQKRLQELSGQAEDQNHKIEQLNSQLRNFYQDLNQRLERPKTNDRSITTANSSDTITASEVVEVPPDVVKESKEIKEGDDAVKPKNDQAFLKEQQTYQTAIDLLPDKKYEASGNKLRSYLKIYPKGVYAANAHYWLGEINFLQKNFDAAEEEFKIVIDKYAKSKRVSDALFKIALVHQNQGRDGQAKQELKRIIKRYPGTSAAQLAKLQLEGN